MITQKDLNLSVYKGDYRPVEINKNLKSIAGYEITGTPQNTGNFIGTYNDSVILYGKSGYAQSVNLCPPPDTCEGSHKEGSTTYNWTLTANSDGSFDFSGAMATGCTVATTTLQAGTYTASGCDLIQLWWEEYGEFLTLPATFTLEQETKVLSVLWYTNYTSIELKNQYIQIEKGETATEYQPYTGNPDYPTSPNNIRPLISAKGSVATQGKNICNITAGLNAEQGVLVNTGNNTYTLTKCPDNRFSEMIDLYVPANTPFTLSVDILKTTATTAIAPLQIQWKFSDETYSTGWLSNYIPQKTANYSKAITGMRFYIDLKEPIGAYTIFKNFQLELGSTATEYHPYFGEYNISCPELRGIEVSETAPYNYTETVDGITKHYICDTLKGSALTRRIGVLEFTGEESWFSLEAAREREFYLNPSVPDPLAKDDLSTCLCNTFTSKTRNQIWKGEMGICWNDTYLRISQSYDDIFGANVEAFKKFLAEQYTKGTPVTLYYILAEPITETVTEYPKALPRFTKITVTSEENALYYGMENSIRIQQ